MIFLVSFTVLFICSGEWQRCRDTGRGRRQWSTRWWYRQENACSYGCDAPVYVGVITSFLCLNGLVDLARILRLLATHHILTELKPNVFSNNRISSFISTGKLVSEISARWVWHCQYVLSSKCFCLVQARSMTTQMAYLPSSACGMVLLIVVICPFWRWL